MVPRSLVLVSLTTLLGASLGAPASARPVESLVADAVRPAAAPVEPPAIVRAQPHASSAALGTLPPGARLTLFPEASTDEWISVEVAATPGSGPLRGFLPRAAVHVPEGPFKDVPGDHWAAPALRRLRADETLSGGASGMFRGEAALNRFEMAVVLDRALTRIRETREAVDAELATVPHKLELAKEAAARVDALAGRLDALAAEEASLMAQAEALAARVDAQGQRLEGYGAEVDGVVVNDREQGRRLEELEQVMAALRRQVTSLRAEIGPALADPEPSLRYSLAESGGALDDLHSWADGLDERLAEVEEMEAPAPVDGGSGIADLGLSALELGLF